MNQELQALIRLRKADRVLSGVKTITGQPVAITIAGVRSEISKAIIEMEQRLLTSINAEELRLSDLMAQLFDEKESTL